MDKQSINKAIHVLVSAQQHDKITPAMQKLIDECLATVPVTKYTKPIAYLTEYERLDNPILERLNDMMDKADEHGRVAIYKNAPGITKLRDMFFIGDDGCVYCNDDTYCYNIFTIKHRREIFGDAALRVIDILTKMCIFYQIKVAWYGYIVKIGKNAIYIYRGNPANPNMQPYVSRYSKKYERMFVMICYINFRFDEEGLIDFLKSIYGG